MQNQQVLLGLQGGFGLLCFTGELSNPCQEGATDNMSLPKPLLTPTARASGSGFGKAKRKAYRWPEESEAGCERGMLRVRGRVWDLLEDFLSLGER